MEKRHLTLTDLIPVARRVLQECEQMLDVSPSDVERLVNSMGRNIWVQFYERMSDKCSFGDGITTAKFVKVCVLYELSLGGCGYGSGTRIHRLIEALKGKDQTLGQEIESWAFHITNNPYIPFGTVNRCRFDAISVDDYRRRIAERDERNRGIEKEKQDAAQQRRRERAVKHAARISLHQKSNAERKLIIQQLASIQDPLKRLRQISEEVSFPPYALPEHFAEVNEAHLALLEDATSRNLLKRLTTSPRGKWKDLHIKLIKELGPNTKTAK